MTKRSTTTYQVNPMAQRFPRISPVELEEIMEWLKDNKYLSELGIEFKTEFWKLFIKERKGEKNDIEKCGVVPAFQVGSG